MSYIIKDGTPIAYIKNEKARSVRASYTCAREAVDANREWNLVNAFDAKISNAQKWESWEKRNGLLPLASLINDDEVLIAQS